MPFKRFVETGRVVYISDGPHKGKLCAIVDVINQTSVLVDGPQTGVPRCGVRLNQIHLTKFRMKYPHFAPTRVVRKAWKDNKIDEQWKSSIWAKRIDAQRKRALLTDFDRFVLYNARKIRNTERTKVYHRLKCTKRNELRASRFLKKAAGQDTKKDPKKKAPVEKKTQEKGKKPEGKKPEGKKSEGKKPEGKK